MVQRLRPKQQQSINLTSAVWRAGRKLTGSTSNWGISKSSSLIITGRPDSNILELEMEGGILLLTHIHGTITAIEHCKQ
jgi:hypothetical protein